MGVHKNGRTTNNKFIEELGSCEGRRGWESVCYLDMTRFNDPCPSTTTTTTDTPHTHARHIEYKTRPTRIGQQKKRNVRRAMEIQTGQDNRTDRNEWAPAELNRNGMKSNRIESSRMQQRKLYNLIFISIMTSIFLSFQIHCNVISSSCIFNTCKFSIFFSSRPHVEWTRSWTFDVRLASSHHNGPTTSQLENGNNVQTPRVAFKAEPIPFHVFIHSINTHARTHGHARTTTTRTRTTKASNKLNRKFYNR